MVINLRTLGLAIKYFLCTKIKGIHENCNYWNWRSRWLFWRKISQNISSRYLCCKGDNLQAIRERGLQVRSIYGDFIVRPDKVTDAVSDLDTPDLVLLAVKSWQVAEIASTLKPFLAEHSLVLPLQNGADNVEKLLEVLPAKNVLSGLCKIISYVEGPGQIHHQAFHPQVIYGYPDNRIDGRLRAVKAVFDEAKVDNSIAQDINLEVWRKYTFITTLSGMGALTRMPVGVLRSDEYLRNMMLQTAQEIKMVANAKGIALNDFDVERVMESIDKQDSATTASMQRDMMQGNLLNSKTLTGM